MTEYISRKDVLAVFGDVHPMDYNANAYIEKIKAIPSADVVERKRGKWIINGNDAMCSNCNDIFCGDWADVDLIADCDMNFCPNCGARMDGADDV